MSLVGSLEDLGLGDILQIVSLARKSGRLVLRTDGDAGWILLCEGQVRGAAIKGQPDDLRSVLVGAGALEAARYDEIRTEAEARGASVESVLVETGTLAAEQVEGLRRARVERAVMSMFLWRYGDFSFEVREEIAPDDEELALSFGINTQYLAMEATRLRDEGGLLAPGDAPDDEPVFSGEDADLVDPWAADVEPSSEVGPSAFETMALASVRGVETEDVEALDPDGATGEMQAPGHPEPVADPSDDTLGTIVPEEPEEPVASDATPAVVEDSVPTEAAVEPAAAPASKPPLIVLDPDLAALEWLKEQLRDDFPRVHIFQRSELGIDRVRRYLARTVVPLVMAAPDLLAQREGDRDLLERLRRLSPVMTVLGLERDRGPQAPPGVDGLVSRPARVLPDPEDGSVHQERANALREALAGVAPASTRARKTPVPPSLENLRTTSDRLRDPERADDVLRVVLDHASQEFRRVAIFAIRDGELVGMAERGLDNEPDALGLVDWKPSQGEMPALFREALEGRRGARGTLSDAAALLERLGDPPPAEAYAAPVESGGTAVALLYGDHGSWQRPVGDTTALEIVLHEAGLALDRAALERALVAAHGDD